MPKTVHPAKAYLEPGEVMLLEKAATNVRDCLLIGLFYHLGCRVSDALALTVEDIDLEQGTVTIQHLKTRLEPACPHCGVRLSKSHTFCPKCGTHVEEEVAKQKELRRVRTLPIDGESLALVKDYILRGGPIAKDGALLLFGISRQRAWQIVKECAEKAGLPKLVSPETGKLHYVGPHKLRDAFAVHAVKRDDSGDGLRLLQEYLGHASFNTTARYRKVSGSELRAGTRDCGRKR